MPTIAHSLFSETIQVFSATMSAAGYQVLLALSGYSDADEEHLLDTVLSRRPEGVLLTGVVAMLFAKTEWVQSLYSVNDYGQRTGMSALGWIVALAPLGLVMIMNFGRNRMSTGTMLAADRIGPVNVSCGVP